MFNRAHVFTLAPERAALARMLRTPALIAAGLAVAFFGVGGLWATLAPIASAAIAEGRISPEGRRKAVQHLEGGIVRDVLIDDGDQVEAGQPLVVPDDVQALAAFRVQEARTLALRAAEARLRAEITEADAPDWSSVPNVAGWSEAIVDQSRIFDAGRESDALHREIFGRSIEQLNEEIAGLRAQIASQDRQIALMAEEIAVNASLLKRGLGRKPRLLELKRLKADVEGDRAKNVAEIARAEQSIGETRLKILELATTRRDEAAKALGETRAELADLAERMIESRDTLDRTVVRAPAAGVIFDLAVQTQGGVIGPGEALMEIVPKEGDLLIDARVALNDIDVVRAGLDAAVTLPAFPQRDIPALDGVVRTVSADALEDEATGETYYLARIAIDADSLAASGVADELVPGMPASAMIFTGARTLADYLFDPLVDSVDRSFREN